MTEYEKYKKKITEEIVDCIDNDGVFTNSFYR